MNSLTGLSGKGRTTAAGDKNPSLHILTFSPKMFKICKQRNLPAAMFQAGKMTKNLHRRAFQRKIMQLLS